MIRFQISNLRSQIAKRPGYSIWPVTFFLVGAALLLLAVSYWFLLPAMSMLHEADLTPPQKRQLAAVARLLLVVVLFVLLALMFLAFHIGRFFVPRDQKPPQPTKYPDAWEEAGRRLPTPPPDDDEQRL